MKKVFVCLTAILLTGILSCAAYADIAPLPDDWDWGTPVTQAEGDTASEAPDPKDNGGDAGKEENKNTAEVPADPEPAAPEPANPGPGAPKTGCSRFSAPLFVLCGGIVFIAAGILGFVIGRRGKGVWAK